MNTILKALFILLAATGSLAAQNATSEQQAADALQSFKQAIVDNDTEKAGHYLHEEAFILEGSAKETKEEYMSHHFEADGNFLKNLTETVRDKTIKVNGNTAWISTVSNLKGAYSGRPIDLTSLELAVLKKEAGQWKIMAIHWSSN